MALTEDLTFMLGDDGVILNTDTSGIPFVDVISVVGLDNAPYRETRREHEGTDGGFMDAEFERGRDVVINADVYADTSTMESYLDSLKYNYAPSRVLLPFYFKAPGVDERLLYVKPLGFKYDWEQLRRTGRARAQFRLFAEDPRIYTSLESSTDIAFSAGALTGFGFNMGFDLGFGGAASTDGAFVNNTGNRPTPPIFTITGPCVSPSIRDETYGNILAFNIELLTGETLEINTQYRTVRLNGTTNRRNTMTNFDWFFLNPGETFIRYGATSGTGSSLNVSFRSAWR